MEGANLKLNINTHGTEIEKKNVNCYPYPITVLLHYSVLYVNLPRFSIWPSFLTVGLSTGTEEYVIVTSSS